MKPNDILDTIIIPWLNKNPDELLYTQKEGLIFFISNADKITFDVWKNHKSSTFYFKNTIINDLSKSINDFGHSLIDNSSVEINKVKNRLPNILDRINKRTAMTFDEEVNKLFDEEGILLIEKCDIDPISVSNENGVTAENIKYQENWELFLWWVISKNNFCRCILHGSANNFSIIGLEDNVKKVVELYEFKRKEIMDNSIEKANKQVRWGLMSLIPISKDKNNYKTYDQNAVHEIKSRTDGYIKDNLLLTIYNQLSDILLKERMNNNDSEVDAFIKGRFPNLGHKYYDIR